MESKLRTWEIYGAIFVIIAGSALHFVYQLSGENPIVGLFAPINESTWEHLKLLFWPALVFSIVEYYAIGNEYNNYFFAKAMAFTLSMLTIIILFYTYTGILGKNYLPLDILVFIIAACLQSYMSTNIMLMGKGEGRGGLGLIIIFALAGIFMLFTVKPPHIGLFLDPVSGSYAITREMRNK